MPSESEQADPETQHESRTVNGAAAWIDLRPDGTDSEHEDEPTGEVVGLALQRVERVVRADDRICPVSTSSIAVGFGSLADGVPLEVLGDRLVRAIGPDLLIDRSDRGLTMAVGMAAPAAGDRPGQAIRRARSAARTSARALDLGQEHGIRVRAQHHAAIVLAVDQAVDQAVSIRTSVSASNGAGSDDPSVGVQLHRRSVHPYRSEWLDGVPVLLPRQGTANHEHHSHRLGGGNLYVVVIDPMTPPDEEPSVLTRTTASMAERVGCRTATAVVDTDEVLITAIDDADVDMVILVLDGAWVGRTADWASGSWGRPAQVTTAYAGKGIPVLAVSAGAGAGALAACVAQGALALFSLDRLPLVLQSLQGSSIDEARQLSELGLPGRFRKLLGLTAGERRVLYYLTEGWTAQDIADKHVVSLATVRSHIRSVLGKLEVKSQLGAVAIANSRDLEPQPITVTR